MKFSYNWIRELVPGLDQSPQELMRLITMKTAECEGLEQAGAPLKSACVARVAGIEWIKGSHNQVVKVETARYGAKTLRKLETRTVAARKAADSLSALRIRAVNPLILTY